MGKTTHVNNNVVYNYYTGKGKGKGGGASTVQYVYTGNGKGKGGGASNVQYVTVANGAGKGKGGGASTVQYVYAGMGKKGGGASAVHYVTGTQTTQNIFETVEYVNVPIHAQAQTSQTKTSVIYYGNRRKR